MAIEELRSEQLSSRTARKQYVITGVASSTAALTLLQATAPTTYNSLTRRLLEASIEEQETEDGNGNIDYIGTMPYGTGGGASTADMEVGDTRILINTVGGSVKITQSLSTEHTFGDAEDHEQAIGVDAEGNVSGTDILTGGLDVTIVKIVSSSALTTAYVGDILSLCTPNPHTNNALFTHTDTDGRAVSFAVGEGLFLGFTNTPRGNGEDELRFNFKGSANLTDALPGSGWTIAKDGWEHLWIRHQRDEDAVAGRIVTKPVSAYVEKVYESGSYALLLI